MTIIVSVDRYKDVTFYLCLIILISYFINDIIDCLHLFLSSYLTSFIFYCCFLIKYRRLVADDWGGSIISNYFLYSIQFYLMINDELEINRCYWIFILDYLKYFLDWEVNYICFLFWLPHGDCSFNIYTIPILYLY